VSAFSARQALRVEQALRLLPEVAFTEPLRALLAAASRPEHSEAWTSEPCGTVGKRLLDLSEVRMRLPEAVQRISERLAMLYEAAVDVLEAEQRGDMAGAVRALLRAGELEESTGRWTQACPWYLHALGIAEELRDRRPEIEALQRVGRADSARGHLERAGRSFQRSLALAEAELDAEGVALACQGLGDVAVARSQWAGAEAWFAKGLEYVGGDHLLVARLTLALGRVALARGLDEVAGERLVRALKTFVSAADAEGHVRVLHAQALVASHRGQIAEVFARHAEALERLREVPAAASLEIEIRLSFGEVLLGAYRLLDAEDQLRRAEELAIAHDLPQLLARLYVVLGKVRSARGDENGFVFFEKALELCAGLEPAPRLAADVWLEYARFRSSLGEFNEARAYFESARSLLQRFDEVHAVMRVEDELGQLPTS
jgi:tetratricopeptide (TPR) repeat protein